MEEPICAQCKYWRPNAARCCSHPAADRLRLMQCVWNWYCADWEQLP